MTILFAFAEELMKGLDKLNQSDLPLGLVSRIRRVIRNFKEEVDIYMPEREKILKEFCTLEKKEGSNDQFWRFPTSENEKHDEFVKKWADLMEQKLVFPYEPIDYLALIDKAPDVVRDKVIAKGSDFEVIDNLNDAYKVQFEKKDESTSVEANKGGDVTKESPPILKD